MEEIGTQYASYVSCICTSLKKEGVTVEDLTTFLLKLPALKPSCHQKGLEIFSDLKTELKAAPTINEIIDILDEKHASFLDYHIYQAVVNKYKIVDDEVTKYPEHVKVFIEKHMVSLTLIPNYASSLKIQKKSLLNLTLNSPPVS